MLDTIYNLVAAYANWIYGWPLLILFTIVALALSIKLKFFQFTKFGHIIKNTLGKMFDKGEGEGNVSPFQATCVALASVIGTGNIAGVAVAIKMGGPGAVFWMWLIALFGLLVKCSEIIIGVACREKDPESGLFRGGFYYTVKNGLGEKWKWLGVFLTVFLICAMGFAPASQISAITDILNTYYDVNEYVVGAIAAALLMVVLLGGIKRISKFAEACVPFMAILYIAGGLFILVKFAPAIPGVIALIFESAFTGEAAVGGFAGSTLMLAIRWGIARGINSNEAGTGMAVLAHSSTTVNHPVKQGLWGVVEVIIDTFIICSITAFAILSTGAWTSEAEGAGLTATAFGIAFGNQAVGVFFTVLIVIFFAFTTCVVNVYYGEVALASIGGKKLVVPFRIIGCIVAFIGAIGVTTKLFTIYDFFAGTFTILNLIVVFALRKKIALLIKDYLSRVKSGVWLKTSEETVEEVLGNHKKQSI